MSLLQSILGAAAGAMTGQQQTQSNPLLQVALSLLSNGGAQGGVGGLGGLQGLLGLFQNKGMGDVIGSWVGAGQNSPISGDQLTQVLGSGQIGQIASQLGLSHGDAASQLAQVLPGLIDQLTPHGQAPAQGFGGAEDIMKMIGGLMQQR
jgi:uncharacterized protein YidB (DUF937 family)